MSAWLSHFTAVAQAARPTTDPFEDAAQQSATVPPALRQSPDDLTLLNFNSPDLKKQIGLSQGANAIFQPDALVVSNQAGPFTCTLLAGERPWNLSSHLYAAVDVRNCGATDIVVSARIEAADNGWGDKEETVTRLPAGKGTTVLVYLKRKDDADKLIAARFPGMKILPNGYAAMWNGLAADRITKVVLTVETAKTGGALEVRGLRAVGPCRWDKLKQPDFFPFFDRYGQFIHAEWPGKIHITDDFAKQLRTETDDLKAYPRPEAWDQYGGYQNGPQLAATGHFRVAKYQGKWWFVDPEGRLFWSHGITGVGADGGSSIKGRKQFFAELPTGAGKAAEMVSFYHENLRRKYGAEFEAVASSLAHKRLSSWGLNTIGNWSSAKVSNLQRTPYTKAVFITGPQITYQGGHCLFDPFDPAFVKNLRAAFAAERDTTAEDPWCIGYFINNEIYWGGGPGLVNEVLAAPGKCAAKKAFLRRLQERYASIQDLNRAWQTHYASWDALLLASNPVDAGMANEDFKGFAEEMIELYYQTCETEMKRVAPHKLNLGSRLHENNPIAIRASARHGDVVSFNKYSASVGDLRLPENLDRPIIIGEFHFLDGGRSFTADSTRDALTERQRADRYWYYLRSALNNPAVIGVHWFQYLDQPLAGRGDGENFPVGFLDVTDTPYANLTTEARRVGGVMYGQRLGSQIPGFAANTKEQPHQN